MCAITGCNREAKVAGLCGPHYRLDWLSRREPCTVDGCGNPQTAKGLCQMHYSRVRSTGAVDERKRMANGGWRGIVCSVDGCSEDVLNAGLCQFHYGRKLRYGSPLAGPPKRKTRARSCSVDGCNGKHKAHGLCARHYESKRPSRSFRRAAVRRRRPRAYGGTTRQERKAARKQLHNVKARALKTGKGEILKVLRQRKCGICGEFFKRGDEKHIDHIIPLARGGTNDVSNLRMAHAHCNMTRGASIPKGTQLPLVLSL